MIRKLLLSIVLIHFLGGCSNLMPADPPDRVLAGIHEFGTTALAFTPDSRQFISGGFRGELRIWDTATLRPLGETHGHRRAVRAILPLASGDFLSGGDDGRLILWHGNRIKQQVQGAKVTALALFQGQVVSGHSDGILRVWSADTLQPLREIPLTDNIVALTAHGNQLGVGLDHAILLLDADFKTRRTIPATATPHDLQFSPDGRTLATEHNGLLTSIAFSPNGRYMATLGRHIDSAVRIIDTTDFKVVQRYQAHELCGAIIRFSPDGHTLASGSDDESVRLYRLDQARYLSSGAIPSAH
jgi:WD40 repeat protein